MLSRKDPGVSPLVAAALAVHETTHAPVVAVDALAVLRACSSVATDYAQARVAAQANICSWLLGTTDIVDEMGQRALTFPDRE